MKILFPNEVILENKNFIVAQDWEVPIVGFFILSTKRTTRSVGEFTEAEAMEFGQIITKVRKAMSEVLSINDVYLFQNEDTQHGFHLWMFPRHEWMEPFGRKIQSVRPIMEHAQNLEVTDELLAEVIAACTKMREYFGNAR
ncbi:diadenosine tetraphosphate hydrolase [Patescibacteria group bacterium]|nr:diadenosine tetraphosphate hydrolase [Patescibacteria group bacterium]